MRCNTIAARVKRIALFLTNFSHRSMQQVLVIYCKLYYFRTAWAFFSDNKEMFPFVNTRLFAEAPILAIKRRPISHKNIILWNIIFIFIQQIFKQLCDFMSMPIFPALVTFKIAFTGLVPKPTRY